MKLETTTVALFAALASTAVTLVTLIVGWLREKSQRSLEDAAAVLERRPVPRVETGLECRFVGKQENTVVTELRLTIANRGVRRRMYHSMTFRLRGIRAGTALTFRADRYDGFLEFPEKLLSLDLVPAGDGYYYHVEPGVTQSFTVTTGFCTDISFLLFHVRLIVKAENDGSPEDAVFERTFTEERAFRVDVGAPPSDTAVS